MASRGELDTPYGFDPMNNRHRITRDFLQAVFALFVASPTLLPARVLAEQPRSLSLISGQVELTVTSATTAASHVRLSISDRSGSIREYRANAPLALEVLDTTGMTSQHHAGYTQVARDGNSLRCDGELHSARGSVFHFSDTYARGPVDQSFELTREITVGTPSSEDEGFCSQFSLQAAAPSPLQDCEVFVPGIWYRNNQHVPRGALAGNLADEHFLIREDRMPLPLVMMRNPRDHVTVTLIHIEPDGSTCVADYRPERTIDRRIQVASLGIISPANPALTFCFPATERDRSYFRGVDQSGRSQAARRVERFHPVQSGVNHRYKLLILLSEEQNFAHAMQHAWRTAYATINRSAVTTDVPAIYEASIKLVAAWSQTRNGCAGIPFRLKLPKGELEGPEFVSYQMGFVGQQLPLASHLLRYGLMHDDQAVIEKGEAMVDFWATNSLTEDGLPRTWFDVYPQPRWRDYDTFLRIASDGMVGALAAWDVMQHYGHEKPEWLHFCRRFGDWLVRHQNPDGSWFRQYDWHSQPAHQSKLNTTHPICFLVGLAKATGERKYLDAALRAGEFCWTHVHLDFAYVGGTPDNANVIDKEAGYLALRAFLALHDVTHEPRWLDAALQAADFTETWAYCWNVPVPPDDTESSFPDRATTTGYSLIAAGHSGADLFLAGAPFFYYRLYLATGDAHYCDVAKQFLHAPRQSVDINGSLGYGHSGLCPEVLRIASPRGWSANVWLPWLSCCMIEPIVRLQQAYGLKDVPRVDGVRLEELRAKDRDFGNSRGMFSGKANIPSDD